MPVAQVTCSICKSTVNKRQTLQVGFDRVCRTHQEAIDVKQITQQAEAAKRDMQRKVEEEVNRYTRHIRETARMKSMHIKEAIREFGKAVPEEYRTLVTNRVQSLGPISDQEWAKSQGSNGSNE